MKQALLTQHSKLSKTPLILYLTRKEKYVYIISSTNISTSIDHMLIHYKRRL